ncbi:MAG: sulfotransferase [Candidatus Poribacteria bacterium]|nr:sulfotransferase [Candidatus Poribacteria bacterium]
MNSDKMLFVVGNSRSGTTMMGRILGNHPDVFTFGELHFFGQLWSPAAESEINLSEAEDLVSKLLCLQREGYRTHGDPHSFIEEARSFCKVFSNHRISPVEIFSKFLLHEANLNGKSIPCDQTPRNIFYINEILKSYPECRIINMIRDPRDVLLSQKQKWKRRFLGGSDMPIKESFRDWINYHPITISKIWNTAISAGDKYLCNERMISIYFEDLLVKPEVTVSHICEFIGIDYTSKMLEVPQVGSSVNTDRPKQMGINPKRAGKWNKNRLKESQLNSAELYFCQKINDKLMKKHNYNPISFFPNLLLFLLYIFSFPVKLILAFLSNLDRIKNIRETLRRRLQFLI